MSVELWTSAAFRAEAEAWVASSLRPLGVRLTGRSEQPHARAWSSAIRFDVSGEQRVWFKVDGPGGRHEPALLRLLAERVPELVPGVVAVDVERGWSLCRDAGPMLREVRAADDSWDVWERVLVRYADAAAVRTDLATLKRLMEATPAT